MRNAPPVQYPVGLFLWGRRAVWGLWFGSLLTGLVLLWGTPLWTWGAVVCALLAWLMAWALRRYLRKVCLSSGQLQWEAGHWYYLAQAQALPLHNVVVLWDAGDRLWLRWRMPVHGDLRWHEAWVLQTDEPMSWHLLRCALTAHTGKNFTQPSHSA